MDSRRWRRANVLVVDDQPANLVAVDAVLSSDFNVLRATSGEEALDLLQSRADIDVILMDVQMPGMDGFEAALRIKQLPGCREIPIVFITAVYHEDPFVKQGYQVGAVDYFSKPFDPNILRAKVGIYAAFRQRSDLLRDWERQVEASRELLAAGRQFAAMLERLPMAVIVMDASGNIASTNEDARAELLGWWDAQGRLRGGCSTLVPQVLANGATVHETCQVRDADGEPRSMLCTASALRGGDGALSGAVLVVRDVTERNRQVADLEGRIGRLVEASPETHSS